VCGSVFAIAEAGAVLFVRWPGAGRELRTLAVSVVGRFLTGLLVPTVDLGVALWATGLLLGIGLSIPIAVVSRTYAGPLGVGAVGGIVIAAIAELAL
jgi:hypothetical protein